MKYQLLKPTNHEYTTLEQVLTNRGMDINDVDIYMNSTNDDINTFLLFGENRLKNAATALLTAIKNEKSALVIVDGDADGYTSSALLINYLYKLFPSWVSQNLKWVFHTGKQHGLNDMVDYIIENEFPLVICPDSASNDYNEHMTLYKRGITTIVLDHHEADYESEFAIVINNQLCDYPNKALSGVGVTWQFCRYLDSLLGQSYAFTYLDLVALGLVADMMDLQSIETKHLINLGFQNITNPFIFEMANKNKFKLGDEVTPHGAAFYIAPFVNAMVRSGTMEEKELLFKSMLQHYAFQEIPSTKRGCKSEMERLVDQAVRVVCHVKERQTKAQNEGVATLERLIEERELLNNNILLFLLDDKCLSSNISGLIANKMMSKYQKPCCILFKTTDEDGKSFYQGSARGCELTGISNFKDICTKFSGTNFAQGHQSAFGLSVPVEKINDFLSFVNFELEDTFSAEPVYFVDYIFENVAVEGSIILDIAEMEKLWGQNLPEPYVAIQGLNLSTDMVQIFRKSTNTIKITLPNKIALMKFQATEEECELLQNNNLVLNIIGRCQKNEWMGNITPQILIEDYEVVATKKYIF